MAHFTLPYLNGASTAGIVPYKFCLNGRLTDQSSRGKNRYFLLNNSTL